jgi:hypothetical protein
MRTFATVVVALLLLLAGAPALAAGSVAVSTLLESPQEFDGQQVTVVGELIGDYGRRDDDTIWTQLNGDPYATSPLRDGGRLSGGNVGIGIHAPAELFTALDPPGRYNRVGPVVSVTGTWRYHDPDRGGETYLEVASLEVVHPGHPLDESVSTTTLLVGVLLVLASIGVLLFARRR